MEWKRVTATAKVSNLTILERLGGTTPEDLDEMRHGTTATVTKGPCAGGVLSVDHTIPKAIAPELDNVIANLEPMPPGANRKKNAKLENRRVSMAKAFNPACCRTRVWGGCLAATGRVMNGLAAWLAK
jgi:hypothetical protein